MCGVQSSKSSSVVEHRLVHVNGKRNSDCYSIGKIARRSKIKFDYLRGGNFQGFLNFYPCSGACPVFIEETHLSSRDNRHYIYV